MENIKKILSQLTGKKHIFITRRGNVSIRESLRYAKAKGFSQVSIQDQGGWITYKQYADQLKLKILNIKTDYGLVKGSFKESILLLNTMPGYSHLQDVSAIKNNNCFVINDASGSLGYEQAKWGDIIIGSFGDDKPVELGRGGFLATDLEVTLEDEPLDHDERKRLLESLQGLKKRQEQLAEIRGRIIKDLKQFEIIHPDSEGINVLVKTKNGFEKEEVVNYCNKHGYEFTECPRYIRMNDPGISIEVKRV
jgi:hypothetical protein